MSENIIFYQLLEPSTSTYTYLLADPISKEAILIDTVLDKIERDLTLVQELDLKLKYVLDTHIHADHITGAGAIRKSTGAQTAASSKMQLDCYDLSLNDGDVLSAGSISLKAIATPGHTDGCMSYYTHGMVFTGDALLIRSAGRTDFQQGSATTLYKSITLKLFSLPEETRIYPGHDYQGLPYSTVAQEKKYNRRLNLNTSESEFVKTMGELRLPKPQNMDLALPANLKCGILGPALVFTPQTVRGIPEISADDLHAGLGKTKIIDVRTPEEFTGELGHVPGSVLAPLGPELLNYLRSLPKDEEIVLVCRSGARSAHATATSIEIGFAHVINLAGGMIAWNQKKYPVN